VLFILLKSWEALFIFVPRLRDAQQRKRGSIFSRCKGYFSLTKRPDQMWDHPDCNSVSIGDFFRGKTARMLVGIAQHPYC